MNTAIVGSLKLHINSLVPLLRAMFVGAGVPFAELYGGHSLRRGFANLATSNGWELNTLIQYVGCRDRTFLHALSPIGRSARGSAWRTGMAAASD